MANEGQLTKDFHIREFKCKDGTKVPAELESNVRLLANQLQVIRDYIGVPIHINSAYRTESYNAKIGGSPKSQHKQAKAADLVTSKYTPKQLANIIKKLIKEKKILQGGVGVYPSFVHYDIRGTEARW
ncbi:MAG: D-Ala-D-Ala carboxypeptidase family metallohydrolase [Pedobacter sp.]|jgi:uncharacterized protein YcbK (DUF882 family)